MQRISIYDLLSHKKAYLYQPTLSHAQRISVDEEIIKASALGREDRIVFSECAVLTNPQHLLPV